MAAWSSLTPFDFVPRSFCVIVVHNTSMSVFSASVNYVLKAWGEKIRFLETELMFLNINRLLCGYLLLQNHPLFFTSD